MEEEKDSKDGVRICVCECVCIWAKREKKRGKEAEKEGKIRGEKSQDES